MKEIEPFDYKLRIHRVASMAKAIFQGFYTILFVGVLCILALVVIMLLVER